MSEVDGVFDGGAAALPLLQQLHSAAGDAQQITRLVRDAERSLHENLHALAEVYGVAVDVYGHAQGAQDYDFRDLCVKQMRALCRLNPTEAREFHNRLRTQSAGRADARIYEARAAMEERLGDSAKAVKMLQEGIRVGAQPAEVLQRVLQRLQPPGLDDAVPLPAAGAGGPAHPLCAGDESGEAPLASAAEAVAMPSAKAAPDGDGTARNAQAAPTQVGSPRSQGAADTSRPLQAPPAAAPMARAPVPRAPRILGLGCPQRRLLNGVEEEEEEGCDEEEDDAARDSGCPAHGGLQVETYANGTISMMPLSPIKEVATPAKDSSTDSARLSFHLATPGTGTPHRQLGREATPSGKGAPPPPSLFAVAGSSNSVPGPPSSPQTAASGQDTPCGQAHEPSAASTGATPSFPSESLRDRDRDREKGSKFVCVNGVSYEQLRTIGRGGSSKVYLVQGPAGETLALKRVATDSATQLDAFLNEVTLLRQLSQYHDRVIQVIDAEVDRERGRINIVMEAGDMDLGRFLQSEPRLSLTQIQHLWRQMLLAVQVVHSERIVHSDLKPGNFLLIQDNIKVIDFGIAKRISNDTTNISRDASVGTLSYMAPEAVRQGQLKLGRASDIWSLGIILYQMVYENPPFAELEPMQRLLRLSDPCLRIQFPPGHRLEGHSDVVKAQLKDVLEGCLQRDPKRRPSLTELLEHPFLRTSLTVPRDAVRGSVEALMAGVLEAAGVALKAADVPLQDEDWQLLADEVWEHLASRSGGTDADGGRAPTEFAGLAPLRDRLRRLAEPRGGVRPLAGSSNVNVHAGRAALADPAATKQPRRLAEPGAFAPAQERGEKENAAAPGQRPVQKPGRGPVGLRPAEAPYAARAAF